MVGLANNDKSLFKEEERDTQFIKQIYRSLGSRIASLLSKTRITPNQVSLFSIATGVAAAYLFGRGDRGSLVIGVLLLQSSLIADYTDGCLARKRNAVTLFGDWLDYNSDLIIGCAIFFGLSWGAFKSYPSHLVWVAGMTTLGFWLMIIGTYSHYKKFDFSKEVTADRKKRYTLMKQFLYTHAFVYLLVCVGALLNRVYLFLWITAAYSVVFYCALLIILGSSVHRHEKG